MDSTPMVVVNGVRHLGAEAIASLGLEVREESADGIRLTLVNQGAESIAIERAGVLIDDPVLAATGDWRVFVDSGTLGWNGVRRLADTEAGVVSAVPSPSGAASRCHRSNLQTVLWDADRRVGVLVGFIGQKSGNNAIDVWPTSDGVGLAMVEAWQEFALRPVGGQASPSPLLLEPGSAIALDALCFQRGEEPLGMLTDFAERVQQAHGRGFEEPPITGYMTWYSKMSAIDQETVTANLPILAELFCGYPQAQRPMLILDHGWQEGACLGPLEPDADRFPDGLGWLAEQCRGYGIEPGIWHSLMNLTEDAPNREQFAPLLARGADGAPLRGSLVLWGAEGGESAERPVNVPDADSERTRDWWRSQLGALSRRGMRYFKLDFLALRTSEENRAHAASGPLHEAAWRSFREAVTADTHLAPCSCDTNLALGYCDSVRICGDIGEAGRWGSDGRRFRGALSAIGAMWYKHRRFWVNDPDSVQIGKGCSLGEARVRATAAAFSGGHLMLSEDLRGIDAARLELFRRLLPAIAVAAAPLDLFESPAPEGYPAIWRLRTAGGDAVALFNVEPHSRRFVVEPGWFGLAEDADWLALEWWSGRWLGRHQGAFEVEVPPQDVAIVHAAPIADEPSVLSCSHHPTGRYILDDLAFDADRGVLSGTLRTRAGLRPVLFGQMPEGWRLSTGMQAHAIANRDGGWQCEVPTTSQQTPFRILFERGA